jgi:AcrR family transcriptional regulator
MAVQAPVIDGRRVRGDRTRQSIVSRSAQLASAEGLEAVSLQRLASDLGISKSGLFAHFGSKEELQLATVEEASRVFTREVLKPGLSVPAGVGRIWALCNAHLSYLERKVFPGGCFFEAAASEFDRPAAWLAPPARRKPRARSIPRLIPSSWRGSWAACSAGPTAVT